MNYTKRQIHQLSRLTVRRFIAQRELVRDLLSFLPSDPRVQLLRRTMPLVAPCMTSIIQSAHTADTPPLPAT